MLAQMELLQRNKQGGGKLGEECNLSFVWKS